MAFLMRKSSMFTSFFMALGFSLILFSLTSATPGIAGFYDPPYYPNDCYGIYRRGVMVALVGDKIWKEDYSACGKQLKVTCIDSANKGSQVCRNSHRSSVIVRIVGLCDDCSNTTTLELSAEAFGQITDPAGAVDFIRVSYHEVKET